MSVLTLSAVLLLAQPEAAMTVRVTPAATGAQLVRTALPLHRGFLGEGQGLEVETGGRRVVAGVRPLSWWPTPAGQAKSVRRAMVTWPATFADLKPVSFTLRPVADTGVPQRPPIEVACDGQTVTVTTGGGTWRATMVAPAAAPGPCAIETAESNPYFLWQRYKVADATWPRVLEVRADVLGGVVLVAHLQHAVDQVDGRAPELGWDLTGPAKQATLTVAEDELPVSADWLSHDFSRGDEARLRVDDTVVYHPVAPYKRRGGLEASLAGGALTYRYRVCREADKVPMQGFSWRRAELCLAPASAAQVTWTLQSPHRVEVEPALWDDVYAVGRPLPLAKEPVLAELVAFHHDAILAAMAVGDDFGNVTQYEDTRPTGGVNGMNRLNHGAPIFDEGYRSGDRRLVDEAVLWCENFYDQSIWWGPNKTGGTRYNNLLAYGKQPPDGDRTYMWRSDDSVSFCTKGYDCFYQAWEETGDPRMHEAYEAQVAYAEQYVDAGLNYTRNIGDVRDALRLYAWTGEPRHLDYAVKLFGDLRPLLSTGDRFTEGGKPIDPDPPFIYDDTGGYQHPFAKPYIIGYAENGLPRLLGLRPEEPKLRDVVKAVADFLVESQDPAGGWRYPHPRSPYLALSQAMEHAWHLVQADKALGPQPAHLDAIELVLRQRVLGWRRSGRILGGLQAWEFARHKVVANADFAKLYAKPEDRERSRDYTEGAIGLGSSAPEGLVYLPEVLAWYLAHRPAERLFAPPRPDEPLGQILARVKRDQQP